MEHKVNDITENLYLCSTYNCPKISFEHLGLTSNFKFVLLYVLHFLSGGELLELRLLDTRLLDTLGRKSIARHEIDKLLESS